MHPNWISGLSSKARAALTAAMVGRRYDAGALVYSRHDRPPGLSLIRSGSASFFLDGANGKRLLLRILVPGHLFGESVAYDGRPAPVSLEARSPLETGVVSWSRLAALIEEYQEIGNALARVSADHLRLTLNVLAEHALMGLADRAVSRLHLLCELEPPAKRVCFDFTQAEFASMLGASRQATNRVLATLEAEGLVSRHFRGIECEPARLAARLR